jgi:hypothetical protein
LPPDALFPRWKSCSQVDLQMGSELARSGRLSARGSREAAEI